MLTKSKKSFFSRSNWKLLALIALLITVAIVATLEVTGTTYLFHDRKAISGTIPSTKSDKNQSDDSDASISRDQVKTSTAAELDKTNQKSSTATSDSTAPLVAPYGTFVSNHKPSYNSANGVPSTEQSVCITTPGANCYITFVNSENITKKLESKIADSKGVVYWDWDVKEAGFTIGAWKITATATLNGQFKSSVDSLDLVVNP